MSKKEKPNIPPYLYENEIGRNFAMIPPDLFESEKFQGLTHAGRLFYILLATHTATEIQKSCLYETLKEYNEIMNLGISNDDIKYMTWGNKRTHQFSRLFVIPANHLHMYGYTESYAYKLKRELITKGFIKAKYGGKGASTAWSKNVTVYEFIDDWKK